MTAEATDASGTAPSVGVHWLSATAAGEVYPWLELVSQLTDGGEVEVRSPRTFYREHHVVAGLVHVLSGPTGEGMPDVFVDVPGAACEWLGLDRLSCIVGASDGLTRVDLAIDGAALTPAQLADADAAGNVRTRSLKATWHEGLRGGDGDTYELGSTSSDRQLVAYDRRGATRVELRLRRLRAEAARELLLGPAEGLLAASVGLVRDMVDFVDREASANVSRAPLLSWWAAFVDGVDRLRHVIVGRSAPAVERRVAWLRESVAPTLVALVRGGLDLRTLMDLGAARGTARHRALTHQMRVLSLTP